MHVSGEYEASTAASIDRCLEVLADVEEYPAWYTGVKTAEVQARDEEHRPTMIALVLDTGVPAYGEIPVELGYDWQSDPAGVALHGIAGTPSRLEGGWVFTSGGGETKIAFALDLDISTPLPSIMERRLGLADKVVDLMIKRPVEGLVMRVQPPKP
jgi:ribosome-associated toxin RatA of RatAB toxin-antitoxin module